MSGNGTSNNDGGNEERSFPVVVHGSLSPMTSTNSMSVSVDSSKKKQDFEKR